jgi:hypothetical protein
MLRPVTKAIPYTRKHFNYYTPTIAFIFYENFLIIFLQKWVKIEKCVDRRSLIGEIGVKIQTPRS